MNEVGWWWAGGQKVVPVGESRGAARGFQLVKGCHLTPTLTTSTNQSTTEVTDGYDNRVAINHYPANENGSLAMTGIKLSNIIK